MRVHYAYINGGIRVCRGPSTGSVAGVVSSSSHRRTVPPPNLYRHLRSGRPTTSESATPILTMVSGRACGQGQLVVGIIARSGPTAQDQALARAATSQCWFNRPPSGVTMRTPNRARSVSSGPLTIPPSISSPDSSPDIRRRTTKARRLSRRRALINPCTGRRRPRRPSPRRTGAGCAGCGPCHRRLFAHPWGVRVTRRRGR